MLATAYSTTFAMAGLQIATDAEHGFRVSPGVIVQAFQWLILAFTILFVLGLHLILRDIPVAQKSNGIGAPQISGNAASSSAW